MEFKDKIKQKLILRGFTEEKILNNGGLIGAVIDETILEVVKSPPEPQMTPYTYTPDYNYRPCYYFVNDGTTSTNCQNCGGQRFEHKPFTITYHTSPY
jgi:hypothetical protein